MSELIIISGPQAAGKSTSIHAISGANASYQSTSPHYRRAKRMPPLIFSLQESRQVIAHRDMLLGAIFMSAEQETDVIKCDFKRMDLIAERSDGGLVYLDECNIFTIAHATAHGITEVKKYWDGYLRRLEKLKAKVVFLNVSPEISWERRKDTYRQRLVYFPRNRHEAIMRRYKDYLIRLHPLLLEIYDKLPFPKEIVDASLPTVMSVAIVTETLAMLSRSFKTS